MSVEARRYQPMTLIDLGRHIASAHSESERRRLVLEFVEDLREVGTTATGLKSV